jgi:hypothetical protein
MTPAYIRSLKGMPRREAQNSGAKGGKTGEKQAGNANDHEQRARVHPAQPSYSVVVPAPELSSIDVAVANKIGTVEPFRKG